MGTETPIWKDPSPMLWQIIGPGHYRPVSGWPDITNIIEKNDLTHIPNMFINEEFL